MMAAPDVESIKVPETRPSTFVFLDFEATGFLGGDQRPKITELCLLAVHRDDLCMGTTFPRVVNKLTLCLNPNVPIEKISSKITGLSNDDLKRQKDFSKDTASLINGFLSHLEEPVCLVAHNGNRYDFPLLKAELKGIQQSLRENIFCADSLEVFRSLDSPEPDSDERPEKKSFKLVEVYRRLYGEAPPVSHTAEDDCITLLKCAQKTENFSSTADNSVDLFSNIKAGY